MADLSTRENDVYKAAEGLLSLADPVVSTCPPLGANMSPSIAAFVAPATTQQRQSSSMALSTSNEIQPPTSSSSSTTSSAPLQTNSSSSSSSPTTSPISSSSSVPSSSTSTAHEMTAPVVLVSAAQSPAVATMVLPTAQSHYRFSNSLPSPTLPQLYRLPSGTGITLQSLGTQRILTTPNGSDTFFNVPAVPFPAILKRPRLPKKSKSHDRREANGRESSIPSHSGNGISPPTSTSSPMSGESNSVVPNYADCRALSHHPDAPQASSSLSTPVSAPHLSSPSSSSSAHHQLSHPTASILMAHPPPASSTIPVTLNAMIPIVMGGTSSATTGTSGPFAITQKILTSPKDIIEQSVSNANASSRVGGDLSVSLPTKQPQSDGATVQKRARKPRKKPDEAAKPRKGKSSPKATGADSDSPERNVSETEDGEPEKKSKTYVPSYVSDERCVVCKDKSTGTHYRAMTCEGCKGFFRRAVQNKYYERYECKKDKSCVIRVGARNHCGYCRYKKCILGKMDPNSVLSPRQRRNLRILIETNREIKRRKMNQVLSKEETKNLNRIADAFRASDTRDFYVFSEDFANGTMDSEQSRDISPSVNHAIKFINSIPGVEKIRKTDLSLLVHQHLFDVFVLRMARIFDKGNNSLLFSNGVFKESDLDTYPWMTGIFQLCKRYAQFVNKDDTAILGCLAALRFLCTDNITADKPEPISTLHDRISMMLCKLLRQEKVDRTVEFYMGLCDLETIRVKEGMLVLKLSQLDGCLVTLEKTFKGSDVIPVPPEMKDDNRFVNGVKGTFDVAKYILNLYVPIDPPSNPLSESQMTSASTSTFSLSSSSSSSATLTTSSTSTISSASLTSSSSSTSTPSTSTTSLPTTPEAASVSKPSLNGIEATSAKRPLPADDHSKIEQIKRQRNEAWFPLKTDGDANEADNVTLELYTTTPNNETCDSTDNLVTPSPNNRNQILHPHAPQDRRLHFPSVHPVERPINYPSSTPVTYITLSGSASDACSFHVKHENHTLNGAIMNKMHATSRVHTQNLLNGHLQICPQNEDERMISLQNGTPIDNQSELPQDLCTRRVPLINGRTNIRYTLDSQYGQEHAHNSVVVNMTNGHDMSTERGRSLSSFPSLSAAAPNSSLYVLAQKEISDLKGQILKLKRPNLCETQRLRRESYVELEQRNTPHLLSLIESKHHVVSDAQNSNNHNQVVNELIEKSEMLEKRLLELTRHQVESKSEEIMHRRELEALRMSQGNQLQNHPSHTLYVHEGPNRDHMNNGFYQNRSASMDIESITDRSPCYTVLRYRQSSSPTSPSSSSSSQGNIHDNGFAQQSSRNSSNSSIIKALQQPPQWRFFSDGQNIVQPTFEREQLGAPIFSSTGQDVGFLLSNVKANIQSIRDDEKAEDLTIASNRRIHQASERTRTASFSGSLSEARLQRRYSGPPSLPTASSLTSPSSVPTASSLTSPSSVPTASSLTSPSSVPTASSLTSPSSVPTASSLTSPSSVPTASSLTSPSTPNADSSSRSSSPHPSDSSTSAHKSLKKRWLTRHNMKD